MDFVTLLLLTALLGLLLLLARGPAASRRGRLPPGPRPLPFLGNILQMDRHGLLKSFLALRDKYGDVFTIFLGPRPVVVLCGPEAVKEALVEKAEEFSGRAPMMIVDSVIQGQGVIFSNGDTWKTLRRFSLATLRDFGMGKRSIEERIQEEAQCLVEELRKSKGTPLEPTVLFHSITANIICSVVFGERFSYDDNQFQDLLNKFNDTFTIASSLWGQLYEMFSDFLKFFPGSHWRAHNNLTSINAFIAENVEKHKESLDPSAPRDFIDVYLLRMEKEKGIANTEFHYKNLIITVMSLFFAGTETTSTTLRYGCLLLLKYPRVAEKVQEEIDQVIGRNRLPEIKDRAKMPYTDAVIHEIQRFSDLLPMGVPHSVTQDTSFRGYLIPKGTAVYPVLSTVLHDPRYFKKPYAFDPNHFLDAQGSLKKSEAFIPFSSGKRICLGEGIARMELFLFLTTILQNFSLSSSMDPDSIDLTPRLSGVGNVPPIYQLRFHPR
ncbi:cytochrome P450 2B4-like isoform X1 [Trichosurus vulpecula]|uniref:cytochrome P450 2B4-like isoform X1 n=1 Tax=Trichosurus vulpecula TaxID=9337 RepID=UPI00186B142C|nr:cytochrome P450 2B4-like isoform X1 [Trichosurus vulpecula]